MQMVEFDLKIRRRRVALRAYVYDTRKAMVAGYNKYVRDYGCGVELPRGWLASTIAIKGDTAIRDAYNFIAMFFCKPVTLNDVVHEMEHVMVYGFPHLYRVATSGGNSKRVNRANENLANAKAEATVYLWKRLPGRKIA